LNELVIVGQHCSEREQRAAAAERELVKIKLLHYLAERLGEEMRAVITGVERFGLFTQGVDLPAEGLIHISSLQDDYYDYDSTTHSLVGRRAGNRFQLGDLVQVEVFHIDVDRRELDFRLVRRLGTSKSKRAASAGTGKRAARTGALTSKPRKPSGGRGGDSKKANRASASKGKRKGRKPRQK
jgi:ribonuclease R